MFRAFLQSLAAFALLVAFGVILAIHAGGPTMVDGAALARLEPAALGAALLLVAWFANGVLGVVLALRLVTSALFALSVNFVPAARLARALERPGVRRVLQFIIGATLVQQAVMQSAQAAGSPHHTVAGFASTPPVAAMVQTQPQGHPASVTQAAPLTAHRARAEADRTFFAPEKEDVAVPATHAEIAATSAVSAISAVDIHATHDQAPAPPVSQAAYAAQSAPVVQVRTVKEVRLIVRDAPALAFTVGFGGMHLAQVSDAIYGNPNGAARIAAANPGLAPGGLVAEGTMLRVPLDGMNAQSALVKVAGDHVNYTIQEGDTLSGIAQTFTGNWRNYVHLGAINTDTITDDNLIYTGNTLRLPADVLTHYTQRARLVTTVRVKTTTARPAESAARHMAAPAAVVHHEAAPLSTVVHHATAHVHAEAAPVRHAAPVRRRAPHFTRLAHHVAHHVAHHAAATATGAGDGVAATWGFAPPPAETVASGTSAGGSVNTKHAAAHHLIVRTREIMGQGPTKVTQAAFHPTHAVDGLRHEAPAHDVAQTPHAHADQGLPIGATMRGALNDVTQSLHELPSVTDGSTNRAIPTTLGAAMLALLGLLLFARRRRVFTAVNVGAISPMGEGMRAAVGDVLAGRRGKAEKAVREKLPSDQGNKVVAALHLLESVGLDPSLICSVTEGKRTLVLAYDISDELDRHTFLADIEAKLPRALKASAKLERGIATFTLRSDPVLAETPPRAHPVPLLVPLGEGADDVVLHLNMARAGSALIAGGMSRDGAAPLAANILVNVVSQDPLGERVKIIAATADPIVAEAIAALPHLAAPVVDANDAQAVEALVHDVYAIVRDNWHPQPSDPTYLVLIEGVDRLSDVKVLDGLVGQAAESKVHIIACANVVNALVDKKATSKFATRIARPLGETEAEVLFGRQGMPAGLLTNEAMVSAFGALARVKPFGIGPELVREHLAQVVAYTLAVAAVGTTASVPDEDMSEDDVLPNTTATSGVLSSTTDVTNGTAPTMEAQASRDDEGEAASGDVVVASLSEAPESVFANMEADLEAARLAALARSAEVERLTANLVASPSVDVPPPIVASHETVAPMAATESAPVVPSVIVAETMTDATGADRVGETEIVETKAADVASPTDALITIPRADAGEEMGEDTRGNMDEDVDGRDDGRRTPPTPREPAPTGEGDAPLTPFTWAAAPDDGLVSVPDVLPTAPVSDETLAALAQGDGFVDAHVPHGIATQAQPSNDEPTLSFELAAADQVPAEPQTPAVLAPAPDVEMTLIGDTTLRINGEVVQLRPQSLSILAALVYYGPKPLKKRWFVDQLWRGEAAAANSRRAFSTLKGELAAIPALAGHDLLQMTESSVGVNQALVSTDIYPIKKLYDAGRGLVGPERLEIEEQFQAIYTDDLFGVKGAKGYEWAFEDIARYREFSLLAKQHIAHALDEGGQWEAALTLATELLAIDSEKESHQILMLGILSGNGLFEEAIRHYQDYVALLARAEPPREPGTRITQIYARTLKKAAAARTAASARTQAGRRPTTDTQVADTVSATTTTTATAVAAQERSRVGV